VLFRSKLIEAADDVGVSFGSLQTAMNVAIRKGIKPSIEGMGELADKYLAIQDPIDRTKFLMDNFGRSGAQLAPLMEKGSAGIKAMGEEAMRTGKIMSTQAVKDARDYEIAMDSLGDSVDGVKMQIGKGLLPVVTKATTIVSDAAQAFNDYWKILGVVGLKIQAATGAISQEELAIKAAAIAGTDLTDVTNDLGNATQDAAQDIGEFEKGLEVARPATELLALRWQGLGEAFQENKAIKQAEEDLKKLNDATTIYRVGLSGAVENELENYRKKQADNTEQAEKLKDEIDKLASQLYPTKEQREELAELREKLLENTKLVNENAEAHALATRKIVLGYMEQNFALNGLTFDEQIALMKVAESFGAIDKGSVAAFQAATKAVEDFNRTGDLGELETDAWEAAAAMDGIGASSTTSADVSEAASSRMVLSGQKTGKALRDAADEAENLRYKIEGIPGSKDITIKTHYIEYHSVVNEDEATALGYQHGGPVVQGRPILVGEAGPEIFVPQQSGRIIPNRTNNYNLTIHTAMAPSIPAEFGRAQAWAGAL